MKIMSSKNILQKVKWGIIGCGNIAHKFVSDLALIEDAELFAVASRSKEKAKEFQLEHQAKKSYSSYDRLLADKEVDIIYIATPHVSHAYWSIKAMENGKHVLCEKPLAINKKETTAIIETSKRTSKFFMEALWTRFNPNFIAIKKMIDEGAIGEIKYIQADFSFKSDKPLNSRVLDINLGGGAILDIGIYPAFLTYSLLGIPSEILAKSIFHETSKCDMQTSMIFQYPDAQAVLYSSFASKSAMAAKISGTQGEIHIPDPWHVPQGFTLIKNNEKEVFDLPTLGLGFSHEIIECHHCIQEKQIESKIWSHQNSMDLISILDKVRKEVGLKYPME